MRHRLITAIATLAATVAVAGLLTVVTPTAAGAATAAAPMPSAGFNIHALWEDYSTYPAQLDRLRAAGGTWVRVDVPWYQLEADGPGRYTQYLLDRMNAFLYAAAGRGIKVMFTVNGTPAWANGGKSQIYPPTDPNTFGNIMRLLALSFAGRVGAWELWNEADHKDYFVGQDASTYVAMVKSAYPKIKAADPRSTVVVGSTTEVDFPWFQRAFDAGLAGSYDALSVHPYGGAADSPPETPFDGTMYTITAIPTLRDMMVRYGDASKKIWFSEFGWSTHSNAGTDFQPWQKGVSEPTAANYLVRMFELVRTEWASFVGPLFWYNSRDATAPAGAAPQDIQDDNRGLMRENLSDKPAMTALQSYLSTSSTPVVSVANASAVEGTSTSTPMTFTLSLNHASTSPVSVRIDTGDDVALNVKDYYGTWSIVTFAPGQTTGTFTVWTAPNSLHQVDRSFRVNLYNPAGATIGRPWAAGTVIDDDAGLPGLQMGDGAVNEGGTAVAWLNLSAPSATPVSVHYSTVSGSATLADYWPTIDNSVTFPAGVTSMPLYFGTRSNPLVHSAVSLTVSLFSPSGAVLANPVGRITINNTN